MSQWTHILGVIRFDSWSCTSFPTPVEKEANLKFEMNVINSRLNNGKVYGSEGPVEIHVIETDRGPTAVITGDLRDFGLEDAEEIINWLNRALLDIHNTLRANESFNIRMTHIRDLSVAVEVEGKAIFYLGYDFDAVRVRIVQTSTLDKKTGIEGFVDTMAAIAPPESTC